jgi:hypothetical protein
MMTRTSFITVAIALLALCAVAQACPMCKESIPNSDAQAAVALPNGFNTSIYYMLGSLFTVMTVFGVFITRTIRATDRAHEVP